MPRYGMTRANLVGWDNKPACERIPLVFYLPVRLGGALEDSAAAASFREFLDAALGPRRLS